MPTRIYFYIQGDARIGPLFFDEIKNSDISKDTLIWHEGLENWQTARELDEFQALFNTLEEAEPTMADGAMATDIVEFTTQEAPILQREATEDSTALDTPANREASSTRPVTEYYPSVHQNHDVNDPFTDGRYQMIYPKQAMFSAPFSFKGRIRRTEYWLSCVIAYVYIVVLFGTSISGHETSGAGGVITLLFLIPGYWFLLAQNTKRCHDRGNSGWFQIIPFYGIWMAFGSSDRFVNEYGPNPKGINLQPRF